jgi:uncharacterized protein YegL
MKKDLTEIGIIVDKSGSMGHVANDAIGGFNTFLKEQKKCPGDANITIVLFDHEVSVLTDRKPVADAPELTEENYRPGGTTALYDAIGQTINRIGDQLNNLPEDERPEKVIIAILTDGEENASSSFHREQINEMISHQTDVYKWVFVFLAANQDAFAAGASIGISKGNIANYAGTGEGTREALCFMACATTRYRSTPDADIKNLLRDSDDSSGDKV